MIKDIDKYISVSVIVPIYNNEKYISQCIKSILCQTLDNIEIILINDCSVDSTLNILNSFKKDSRITIINLNHNIGSGIARNIGIMISKAKYIAFIDGDDLYPDIDVLESLYNNALSQKALICGGSLYTIDENNNIKNLNIKKQVFNNYGWIKFINYQYIGGFYRFIYEREFLKKNHIYFPKYRRFQDAIFLLYAMIRVKKFYIINKYVYSYRKNYKKIIWDYVKSRDHLLCIFEILKISKKNKYTILYHETAQNFLNFLRHKLNLIIKIKIIKLIVRIFLYLDWDIISKENKKKVAIKLFKYKYIISFFKFNMLNIF